MTAFQGNWSASLTVEYLNLAENRLDEVGSTALDQWLFAMKSYSKFISIKQIHVLTFQQIEDIDFVSFKLHLWNNHNLSEWVKTTSAVE